MSYVIIPYLLSGTSRPLPYIPNERELVKALFHNWLVRGNDETSLLEFWAETTNKIIQHKPNN